MIFTTVSKNGMIFTTVFINGMSFTLNTGYCESCKDWRSQKDPGRYAKE